MTIKKPTTTFQIMFGAFISIFHLDRPLPKRTIPTLIGKYKLILKIKKTKDNPFRNFDIGVYQNQDKKFFIKTWQGKIHDINYYSLINEYLVSKLLFKKTKKGNIKVAKPINISVRENSLSVVYEFVEGKNLKLYPLGKQAEVISEVIKSLFQISKSLTKQEKSQLTSRTKIFYILSLPLLSLILAISSKFRINILTQFLKTILAIFSLPTELTIAHRDLSPGNILVNDSTIYLLDNERAVLTIPNYDLTNLSTYLGYEKLTNLISKRLKIQANHFIKNFIAIQCAVNNSDNLKFRNHYLNILKANYAI